RSLLALARESVLLYIVCCMLSVFSLLLLFINHFIHIKSFCPKIFLCFFQNKTVFLIKLKGELGGPYSDFFNIGHRMQQCYSVLEQICSYPLSLKIRINNIPAELSCFRCFLKINSART